MMPEKGRGPSPRFLTTAAASGWRVLASNHEKEPTIVRRDITRQLNWSQSGGISCPSLVTPYTSIRCGEYASGKRHPALCTSRRSHTNWSARTIATTLELQPSTADGPASQNLRCDATQQERPAFDQCTDAKERRVGRWLAPGFPDIYGRQSLSGADWKGGRDRAAAFQKQKVLVSSSGGGAQYRTAAERKAPSERSKRRYRYILRINGASVEPW